MKRIPLQHSSNRGRRSKVPWGVSITALAQRVGCHPSHIGRVLKGEARPSLEVARKLAKVLGITVEYMLERIERTKKENENGNDRG